MDDLDVPVYDETLHIEYKNAIDVTGSGKKTAKKGMKQEKKEEFIDAFYTKQFIKSYFSKTK